MIIVIDQCCKYRYFYSFSFPPYAVLTGAYACILVACVCKNTANLCNTWSYVIQIYGVSNTAGETRKC